MHKLCEEARITARKEDVQVDTAPEEIPQGNEEMADIIQPAGEDVEMATEKENAKEKVFK